MDHLQLRPIFHQLEHRIEAHIYVAFLAYCLHITLRAKLKPLAQTVHTAGPNWHVRSKRPRLASALFKEPASAPGRRPNPAKSSST